MWLLQYLFQLILGMLGVISLRQMCTFLMLFLWKKRSVYFLTLCLLYFTFSIKLSLDIFSNLSTFTMYKYAAHLSLQTLYTYLCSTYYLNATLSFLNRLYIVFPLNISRGYTTLKHKCEHINLVKFGSVKSNI